MDESPLWHANDDDDLRSIEAFSVSFCSERWANDNVGTLHGVQDGTTTLDQEVSVSKKTNYRTACLKKCASRNISDIDSVPFQKF